MFTTLSRSAISRPRAETTRLPLESSVPITRGIVIFLPCLRNHGHESNRGASREKLRNSVDRLVEIFQRASRTWELGFASRTKVSCSTANCIIATHSVRLSVSPYSGLTDAYRYNERRTFSLKWLRAWTREENISFPSTCSKNDPPYRSSVKLWPDLDNRRSV